MRDAIYAAVHAHAALVTLILSALHAAAAVYHVLRVMERRY
jgi:cytochrome b561